MQVLVVHFADIGGQGLQSGFAGGPPAAFATDNQVASVVGAFDRDGLDYAQRADRVGQLFERLFIELRARLVEQLEKFFSQEISIKRSKNGGGRIVIDFSDDRDIDRFIEKFEKRGASAEIRNNK